MKISSSPDIRFGPYAMDIENAILTKNGDEIPLRHKSFSVLTVLVQNAGQVVSKDQILDQVWEDRFVQEAAIKVCISELRKTLDDKSNNIKHIQTLHGRGYRFQVEVELSDTTLMSETRHSSLVKSSGSFVGRQAEVKRLEEYLEMSLTGRRQVTLIKGESGIGKSALVDNFLHYITRKKDLLVCKGECIAYFGESEAFLPIIVLLGRLLRGDDSQKFQRQLQFSAPSWCAFFPEFFPDIVPNGNAEPTPGKLIREMTNFFTQLAKETPLVIVLDDLHWSDISTLDLLSYLVNRQEDAQLHIIAIYRPLDQYAVDNHLTILRNELLLHQKATELTLDFLSEIEVLEYVTYAVSNFYCTLPNPERLAQKIYDRTKGQPLFLSNVISHLISKASNDLMDNPLQFISDMENHLEEVPETLKTLILQQVSGLDEDCKRILVFASLLGLEFPSTLVANCLEMSSEYVERQLTVLVKKRLFIEDQGYKVWPNKQSSIIYSFRHSFYPEVLSDLMTLSQRTISHLKIANGLEEKYSQQEDQIAPLLASHFEKGYDFDQATDYYQRAAENAIAIGAYQEANLLISQALMIVHQIPDLKVLEERDTSLMRLAGTILSTLQGWAAPEAKKSYLHTKSIAEKTNNINQLGSALWGLAANSMIMADMDQALLYGQELKDLAESYDNRLLLAEAYNSIAMSLCWMGEFKESQKQFHISIKMYDPNMTMEHMRFYGLDPKSIGQSIYAVAEYILGNGTEAKAISRQAIDWALQVNHPYSQAISNVFGAMLYQIDDNQAETAKFAKQAVRICQQHNFPLYHIMAEIFVAWADASPDNWQASVKTIKEKLLSWEQLNATWGRGYFSTLMAQILLQANQTDQALAILEAIIETEEQTSNRFFLAEIYLTMARCYRAIGSDKAISYAEKAMEVALSQNAAFFRDKAEAFLSS